MLRLECRSSGGLSFSRTSSWSNLRELVYTCRKFRGNWFDAKLRNRGLTFGILITTEGITGEPAEMY